MKDEIKEILDEMYHIICTYSDDFDYFEENKINFELSYKNMEKLYDYITTLQEENENLKEDKRKALNILKYSASNKGMCTQPSTDSIQSALLVLQGDDNIEN